jgi:hypothetical protein
MTATPPGTPPGTQRERRAARELSTREGAEQLARQLNEYWRGAGYPLAEHWIESRRVAALRKKNMRVPLGQLPGDESATLWCVRSNLVNGLPPTKPPKAE